MVAILYGDDGRMMWGPTRLQDGRHPAYPAEYDWPYDLGSRVPDISDPATRGCLLGLVREAHGAPWLQVSPAIRADGGPVVRWIVYPNVGAHDGRWWEGPTETAALLAAAKAAT